MGIQERKEREKTERKALILRCARELVRERGSEAVSMTDIARMAELSKATLYLYFESKDELFRVLCRDLADQYMDYYRSRLRPESNALECVMLLWESYLDLYAKSDDLFVLFSMRRYLFPVPPCLPAGEAAPMQGILDTVQGIIEQGIGEGVFEEDVRPALIAHTIVSLFSLVMENTADAGGEGMMDDLKFIFQVILRGITKTGLNCMLPELSFTEPATGGAEHDGAAHGGGL
ncbi:MAG: TetR/AcrR family transcriptional regulator [Spirochaetaceae bacterium]|jgi:AcrR family transcriptional regulator|nr:TetR/AcrR family transcriptional regulator [Spirochaetaceae bacterium]